MISEKPYLLLATASIGLKQMKFPINDHSKNSNFIRFRGKVKLPSFDPTVLCHFLRFVASVISVTSLSVCHLAGMIHSNQGGSE